MAGTCCGTRITETDPVCRNKYTYLGIVISATIAGIIVYVPFINTTLLQCAPAPAVAFAAPVLAGTIMFAYEFVRRFVRMHGMWGACPFTA